MYGSSGTGKWDIYGNGANLRIGDNESAGAVVLDTALRVGTTEQGRETDLAVVGPDQLPTGAWSQLGIYSNDSYAINKGGSMMFGGQDGLNVRSWFAGIKGAKENSTNQDYAGYLAFYTRPSGSVPVERMRVSSAGKVGINTTSANTRLQVSGNSANQLATYFCVEGTYPVVYYRDTEANQNSFATYCDGSSFFIQSVPYANRNDANPSSSFQTGVYLSSNSGSWGSTSDENLKTNLVPIENGLAKVNTLRSVIGEFIDDAESKRSPFLIAQDVQAVLPEAVETIVKKVTDENGEEGSSSHLGLQYTAVIPLLVAAIKELSDKNDALETQNATFAARLTALEGV
jgi:hypothetical protein